MSERIQKCPVCDGTGLVSRPPGIAGDQKAWTPNSTGPWPCRVCGGVGVLTAHGTVGYPWRLGYD